jgi:hypothetical protein
MLKGKKMADEMSKTRVECEGPMSPILIMDKTYPVNVYRSAQELEYRRPDDSRSFWTGKFPTAGPVRAFLCGECGRIALYGVAPDA